MAAACRDKNKDVPVINATQSAWLMGGGKREKRGRWEKTEMVRDRCGNHHENICPQTLLHQLLPIIPRAASLGTTPVSYYNDAL